MAESARRKNNRAGLEIQEKNKYRLRVDPDNPDNEEMARFCPTKGQHILNPIIDWSTEDIWEFIHNYNIPYCKLYDCGYERLGCIGCPMAGNQKQELEAYPKYKQAYLRAFERMLDERKKNGLPTTKWDTAEDVMEWWTNGYRKE